MLYVGIDPGESWCGFAALDVTSRGEVRVEARTYSVKQRGGYLAMSKAIVDMLPHSRSAHIACEDFRIRRSGHQHFNHGDTLRFIGALEYGITSVDAFQFFLIPPNDHGAAETKELFGRVLCKYRRSWPRPSHPAWGHCISAWRVLGNHLMTHDQALLLRILKQKKSHRCAQWLPSLASDQYREHIAPAGKWLKS